MKWALLTLAVSLMFVIEAKAADVVCGFNGCVERHHDYYGPRPGYGPERRGEDYGDRYRDRYFGDDRYGPHYPRRCAYLNGVRVCQ
jgi:hypothetical protein